MSVDVFITILCVCSLEFCGLSCSRLRPWSMKLPIVYKLLTKTLCFNTVMIKSFMFAFRMPHKFKKTSVSSCSNSDLYKKKKTSCNLSWRHVWNVCVWFNTSRFPEVRARNRRSGDRSGLDKFFRTLCWLFYLHKLSAALISYQLWCVMAPCIKSALSDLCIDFPLL